MYISQPRRKEGRDNLQQVPFLGGHLSSFHVVTYIFSTRGWEGLPRDDYYDSDDAVAKPSII